MTESKHDQETKAGDPAVDSNCYVQNVPDHCDRIIWKNKYYQLPPNTEALRQRVKELEKEVAQYRNKIAEWLDRNLMSSREYAEQLRSGEWTP